MNKKIEVWDLATQGAPEYIELGDIIGEGNSKKVFRLVDYPNILLAHLKIYDKTINSESDESNFTNCIELSILQKVREAVELRDAKFPFQIPYCDIESGRLLFATEYYGETLEKNKNYKPNINDVLYLVINLIKLSNQTGIPSDNHSDNLTIDNKGIHLIDIKYMDQQIYFIISHLGDFSIKKEKGYILDKITQNKYIEELCNKRISLASQQERQEVIQFLEQLLEEEKEKESSEKRSFGE